MGAKVIRLPPNAKHFQPQGHDVPHKVEGLFNLEAESNNCCGLNLPNKFSRTPTQKWQSVGGDGEFNSLALFGLGCRFFSA